MFEAIAVGPFIIWSRALLLFLGIIIATEFFLRLAKTAHLSLQHFREHALVYFWAFLIGGRLTALILAFRVYVRDPLRIFVVWDGGFSFLGGAIGIACVLFYVTREHRSTFLQWLDALLPATTLGLAFDWIGKYATGIAYGRPSDMPWAVTFDTISVRYTVPVHPVQLYYAFFFFLVTFLLLIVRKYRPRAGSSALVGIVLASLATIFFEYFRGDFSIHVFASRLDFIVLALLFLSLGIFAAVELSLSKRAVFFYEIMLVIVSIGYLVLRSLLSLPTMELRFSQFLAVLSLLAIFVYVVVHRRKHPHL